MQNELDDNEEIVLREFSIDKFVVSNDLLIFTIWNSNKLIAFDFKDKNYHEIDILRNPNSFVINLKIIKSPDKLKYVMTSTSDGTLMIYKIKSKLILKQ